jgi:hypothetical protein
MRGLIVNSGASAQAAKLHPCQLKLSARACWSWRAALLSPAELRGAKGAPAIYQGPWPIRKVHAARQRLRRGRAGDRRRVERLSSGDKRLLERRWIGADLGRRLYGL